ncbi:FMN-binding negative transcriptional regulator [Kribbella turkmenica]|uniref:FMN-binding negative transcriptional regulator n=1 Tax=Kribbella turkmenica TaxID=2530375 RepID=UPI00192DD931
MYVPAHFAADDQAVQDLLTHHGAADLVTMTPDGLMAPCCHLSMTTRGECSAGNLARNNDHWRQTVVSEALMIRLGPDLYISPTWYASKRDHCRVVPTWNHLTVHAYGSMAVHDDPVWVSGVVRRLSDHHEAARAES